MMPSNLKHINKHSSLRCGTTQGSMQWLVDLVFPTKMSRQSSLLKERSASGNWNYINSSTIFLFSRPSRPPSLVHFQELRQPLFQTMHVWMPCKYVGIQRYSALSQYIFNKQQLVVHTITNPWFCLPYWASMFTGLSTCISDEESNRRKLFSAACPSFVLACPKSLNRPLNKQALDLIYSKAVLTWKIKEIGLQADIFEGKRDQAI